MSEQVEIWNESTKLSLQKLEISVFFALVPLAINKQLHFLRTYFGIKPNL